MSIDECRMEEFYLILINVVIWKVPVEYECMLSYHEDHEEKKENIDVLSSCPSW